MRHPLVLSVLSAFLLVHSYADAQTASNGLVTNTPGLLRFYDFSALQGDVSSVASTGSDQTPLQCSIPFTIVPGRDAGKTAVRIDDQALHADPFSLASQHFTAEIWFKLVAAGTQRGNGDSTSGTIMSIGIGYWDGWRLTTSYPGRKLAFELGRPRGINAFGIGSPLTVANRAWQHAAVSWDGSTMRLYVNGLLSAQAPYSDPYTQPAADARFKIGFAGFGFGSVVMDVEQVAVFSRALRPAEIASHALDCAPPADDLAALIDQAQDSYVKARGDDDARTAMAPLLAASLPATWRLWAQLASELKSPRAQNVLPIMTDPQLPPLLAAQATDAVIAAIRDNPKMALPDSVYDTLLANDDLDADTRNAVALSRAFQLIAKGQIDQAQQTFDRHLARPDISPAAHSDITLSIAHAFRGQGHYDQARQYYQRISQDQAKSPAHQAIAALASAQTYALAGDYAQAAAAFTTISVNAALMPHHRQEAAECASECRRQQQGLPPLAPDATRQRPTPPPPPTKEWFVAPEGSDQNDGSAQRPFASIHAACAAIRQYRATQPASKGSLVVTLAGGSYDVTQTTELTSADCGSAEAPLHIRAATGEKPVLTGGVILRHFQPVTDPAVLARIPAEARALVLQHDLRDLNLPLDLQQRPLAELFCDDRPLTVARWPNSGFVTIDALLPDYAEKKTPAFIFADQRPARWTAADDIWLTGYWVHHWAADTVKVKAIDLAAGTVALAKMPGYGLRSKQHFFAFNLLEELDQPGEWFLDRQNAMLYLFPAQPVANNTYTLSRLNAPFLKLNDVSHVVISGLHFAFNQANAIEMTNVSNGAIIGCSIKNIARDALVCENGSHLSIYGNDFLTIGRCGMRVSGGKRRDLSPSGIVIENNVVNNFSRLDRTYTPALHLEGVGTRVAHNLFCDSPHHAIRVEGNDHAIVFNEVHSVVYESDDQSGIDMWYNPTYQGNVISYNFWHHIGSGMNVAGQSGIRLDDAICNVVMVGNVFLNAADGHFGGIQIHGGKDNVAENNLFISCKAALSFSPWGEKRWLDVLKRDNMKQRLYGDIAIDQDPYASRYPWLASLHENHDRNFIWRNLAVDCDSFFMRPNRFSDAVDNLSVQNDPGFTSQQDFTLRPNSWAQQHSAFRPIPFREIGLYQDELRASWPVKFPITDHYRGPHWPLQ